VSVQAAPEFTEAASVPSESGGSEDGRLVLKLPADRPEAIEGSALRLVIEGERGTAGRIAAGRPGAAPGVDRSEFVRARVVQCVGERRGPPATPDPGPRSTTTSESAPTSQPTPAPSSAPTSSKSNPSIGATRPGPKGSSPAADPGWNCEVEFDESGVADAAGGVGAYDVLVVGTYEDGREFRADGVLTIGAGRASAWTPTPSATPTGTPDSTWTPAEARTGTREPAASPGPSGGTTVTPGPTSSPTATASGPTSSPTRTATATQTPVPAGTEGMAGSPTPSRTPTPESTSTAAPEKTPTRTPTPSRTAPSTPRSSPTATPGPTDTSGS
jgi:hypothetical protein